MSQYKHLYMSSMLNLSPHWQTTSAPSAPWRSCDCKPRSSRSYAVLSI